MRTSRLVVAVLILCSLVILATQNLSPSLSLVFLGLRSVPLPLGVWLVAAIALGILTTIGIFTLLDMGAAPGRAQRRQWRVQPDEPPPSSRGNGERSRSFQTDNTARSNEPPRYTPPRREPHPPRDSSATRPSSPPQAPSPSQTPSAQTATRKAAAAEDWRSWGQRTPASQWEDWSQAGTDAEAEGKQFSRRQRKDREQAESTIQDLEKGWDDTAQDTVYVAPGGSDVEDALDDITEGWDDWQNEAPAPAETAYSEGYGPNPRVDSVYAPPDDVRPDYQDWRSPDTASDSREEDEDWGLDDDDPANGDPDNDGDEDNAGVYDADYRVIIPPYRPLDETGDTGDRAP